jgi:hypothetical protein
VSHWRRGGEERFSEREDRVQDTSDVYVYIGLDRLGNIVEVRRAADPAPAMQLDDSQDDYEVVGAVEVLRRKTMAEGRGSDPDCIRGPDGRVRCF